MKAMRKQKSAPGYDGQFEARPAIVVSPYLNAEVKGQQTEKVMRNVRHDVLEFEFAHKRIDEVQKAAGDMLLATYEQAGIGGAKAIDYEQPKVDSSIKGDTLTDGVIAAHIRLDRIGNWLGKLDAALLRQTICLGKTFQQVADAWGAPFATENARREAKREVGDRFRRALRSLSDMDIAKGSGARLRTHIGERSTHRPDMWESHVPLHHCGSVDKPNEAA